MACNNIGNKLVCGSSDEARAVDRRTNGDDGDSALDTLAGVPQFFNATAKYITQTDSFFGENRPWKGNFFSADVTVINNPLTRIAVGFPLNFAGGILNTVSVGYLKEGLDAVGLENHLSPPPSTKYEAYNYVNGNLLLLASVLAVFVRVPPKAAAASQVATAPEKTSPAAATTAGAVAEKPAPVRVVTPLPDALVASIETLPPLQRLMLDLDMALTGNKPKTIAQLYQCYPKAVQEWLVGSGKPVWYLSDSGLSRVVWRNDIGVLHLTSNSTTKVAGRWAAAAPQREALLRFLVVEHNRLAGKAIPEK